MMLIIIIMAVAIGLAEGIPLAKQGLRKEIVVISVLLGIVILLATGNYLGFSSPLVLFERLLEPIGKTIFK